MRGLTWIIGGILVAMASRPDACCMTYAERSMRLARETALIIWDKENGVEHFIRKAEFEGNAADFGFIFPSPTEPFRLAVADHEVFGRLDAYSPVEYKSEESGDVEILQQKEVGDFDATVLRAKDGSAMSKWLKKQGHRLRPAITPWFDHYAKQGWVFTALKYKGRREVTPTKALCISFKTSTPHYPYKMPSDTWEKGHHRTLDLFVLSQSGMKGVYTSGKDWETKKRWDAGLSDADRLHLETNLLVDHERLELPKRLVITRFANSASANHYEHDLLFQSVGEQSPGTASKGNSGSDWPVWLGGIIVAGGSVVVWTWLRRALAPRETGHRTAQSFAHRVEIRKTTGNCPPKSGQAKPRRA